MINCIIAGVGGQGTVLASKLIAAAAMDQGLDVRTTETIGMAQRGGSVVSHVRIGEHIHSPLVPLGKAHLIIAFEPAEAVRVLPFLSGQGVMVVCDSAIKPVTSSLSGDGYAATDMLGYLGEHVTKLVVVSGEQLLAKCASAKALNVALLGAAIATGALPLGIADIERTIKAKLPERFWAMNLTALDAGRSMVYEAVSTD